MGLFDLFKQDKAKKERGKSSPAAKWADRIEKRAQNYDRQEAIQALADLGTADAVGALLKRFTFHIDPSITDQEEKDASAKYGKPVRYQVQSRAKEVVLLAIPLP